MAEKVELKERGTNKPIYPITLDECVLDSNGNSIKLKVNNSSIVWTAEPVVIEGVELYCFGGNYGDNPLNISKYKDGDIIKVFYGGMAYSNNSADDLWFTGIISGNIMLAIANDPDSDLEFSVCSGPIAKNIANNVIELRGELKPFVTLTALNAHANNDNRHVPSGGEEGQLLLWQSIGRAKWGDLSEIFSYNPADFFAYGVEWDVTVADPHITRIGNMSLHKTLPIQSQLKGCIALGGKVMYWLNEDDWRFRKNPIIKTLAAAVKNDGKVYINDVDEIIRIGLYVRSGNSYGEVTSYITVTSPDSLEYHNVGINVDWVSKYGAPVGATEIEIGSRLDGYDGTVRVYCPKFYIKSESDGNKRRVWISTVKIDDSWHEQPSVLIDAWHCTILNEVPENMGYLSTLQVNSAVCIKNTNTYCRGGNNSSSWDKYLTGDDNTNVDEYRTLLGKPRTSITRANMRNYVNLANSHILSYDEYKNVFYWLYVIEYANFNCQEEFNSLLTTEGYRLGGLGLGLTNMSNWNEYNGYFPISPCGYNINGGNTTDKHLLRTAYFYVTVPAINDMSKFIINNNSGTIENGKAVITDIKNTGTTLYTAYNNTSNKTTYKFTGLTEAGVTARFRENYLNRGEISEDGTIDVDWFNSYNRDISFSAAKSNVSITIEVVSAEEGRVMISEKELYVPTWRGFLNPFGDIWNNLDGVIIDADANNHSNNMDYVYTCLDPEKFADTLTEDYIKVGEAIHLEGYIKEFDLGDDANIFPNAIGGNTTLYKCDYRWSGDKNTMLRSLIAGGSAVGSAGAGLGGFYSVSAVSGSGANVGFRSVSRFVSFSSLE